MGTITTILASLLVTGLLIYQYLAGERKKDGKPFFEVAKIFSSIGIFMGTGSFLILGFALKSIKEVSLEFAGALLSLLVFLGYAGFGLVFVALLLTAYGFMLEVKNKESYPKNK